MSILDRTYFYSNRKLDEIIQQGIAAKDSHNLLWVIECKIPSKLTPDRKICLQAAVYPGNYIPAIPVGEDPVDSRDYAEWLLWSFRKANAGRGIEYALLVTTRKIIHNVGAEYYEWGDPIWDNICQICGGVFKDTLIGMEICSCCKQEGFSTLVLTVDVENNTIHDQD